MLLTPQADSPELRREWDALAHASGNIFLTPDFADVWRRHLGDASAGEPLLLGARDDDGALRALWPLAVRRRGPVKLLRQLGHGPADELGPVCAPADREAAGRALREARRALPASLMLAERLPSDVDWAAALGARPLVAEASPVLPTGGVPFDEYLKGRSGSFRSQVGRRRRKLEREHEVAFRLASTPEEVERDMTTLFALHAGRWEDASDSFAPPLDALHREFAQRALERGWLRLWTLSLDGRDVAAWYGFRFSGAESYYQSGREPEAEELNVGNVLLAHTIRAAFDDGMREYRFLRGNEPYKRRWSEDDRAVLTMAVPLDPVGRAAAWGGATAAGSDRLRSLARRLGLT